MNEQQMQFSYDRRRTSTLTLDEQPGAHTGATRKYIPGYSDANIVFLNTSTGNDANTGASIAQALLTYSAAVTAAGTTKKIRLVNSATLTSNITKPTEATIGTTSTIASASMTAPANVFTQAGTPAFTGQDVKGITWATWLSKYFAVGTGGLITSSPDANTWATVATPSFSTTDIMAICASDSLKTIVAVGASGKIGYSTDGSIFTQCTETDFTGSITCVIFAECINKFIAASNICEIGLSADGVTWEMIDPPEYGTSLLAIAASSSTIVLAGDGFLYSSTNGIAWEITSTPIASTVWTCAIWSEVADKFVIASEQGTIYHSADGDAWTVAITPSFGGDEIYCLAYSVEIGRFVAGGNGGKLAYSASNDPSSWTQSATPSFGADTIRAMCWSPLTGKFASGGGTDKLAYSTAYATTISAHVAGFSIQAVQYSGTVTAYNCTLRQPGTTAALSLDACRVEYDSHISNNAVTSRATLYRGDRHLTCTPASQNAIDLNLDTWGGTFYIYNASQTGYERIRDCLGNGPIVANYPVTVGGRANVEGTSVNVLFDAEVTHNDPRFVDETDYKLEFQTNGYTRNSFAAARSNIYFNSAGDARDIGAWSYVESAVSYYYAKTEVMYKGEISHGLEFALNEQQGDSGVVSVYGNTRRVKEVITISYGTTYQREKAIFEYMLTLQDKGIKIQLDAEWSDNAGTVVVNGNQSAGVEFLTVDSTVYYEGMWLTIAGKQYWVMRASPSPSVATKLILDRPLEDAVLDNDVIVRNYPAGAGEYQFSGPMNLTLKRVHPTALQGYYSGFQIRLVRKKQ